MKRSASLVALILSCLISFSQETELRSFQRTINAYLDFTTRQSDSLPLTPANHTRFRKAVDDAFREYVLQPNSATYEKLVAIPGEDKSFFLRADNRVSIYTRLFPIGNKTFVAYSYTSMDKQNYVIRDNTANRVVYEGDSKAHMVDGIYGIDSTTFLLVEKNGHLNSSRSVFVLSARKLPWVKMKAFEGQAFGQVPGQYLVKKYVKRRFELQLEYEVVFGSDVPKDINTIFFDNATKTISYKQYTDAKKFKLVSAKWTNKTFVIDDHDVNDLFGEDNSPVPQ